MLTCKHSKFTLNPAITYLNCAYMSPLLKSVEKAGIRGLRLKRNPSAISGEDFFAENLKLRNEFATLINAPTSRISIIPSVSYGMATVVKNISFEKGQNVIVASEQFPSNYYAWQKVCEETGAELVVVAPPDTRTNRGLEWNTRILESINANTKVVAIGNVHWADGTKFDLAAIRKRTTEVGAALIIDGTQSVGALDIDVEALKPDALIVAGYKWMLGPYSIGLAYYGEFFDGGSPLEENWISRKGSEDFAGLVNYQSDYKEGAFRFDVGEHSNFILVPMMIRALQQINRWNADSIQQYCGAIIAEPVRVLRDNGFWVEDEAFRGNHLFGIRLREGSDINKIKTQLSKKKIFVSFRGDAIRVSPNVYNSEPDLMRLVNAIITS